MIRDIINQILEIEQDMKAILVESRELAKQIRENADKEAQTLLDQARKKAEAEARQIVADAQEQIEQMRRRVMAEAEAEAEQLPQKAHSHMDEAVSYVVAQVTRVERD